MRKQKNILAIVGPKGGVGKSTISANLAIALSKLGKKVIVADLDLGGSNLHAVFGIRECIFSLNDFVLNKIKNLSSIVIETGINNLGLICGGDIPGIANMPYQKKLKLIRHLSMLDCDIVLLDLSAGASFNVVDFLIISERALLVTTPEVLSLLKAYSFIKSTIFRQLSFLFKYNKCFELVELLEKAKDFDSYPHLKTIAGILEEISKVNNDIADSARELLSRFKPYVIVNRVQNKDDVNTGKVVQSLMQENLSLHSGMMAAIREDKAVKEASAKMKPIMMDAPMSMFCQDTDNIAKILCESNE